MTGNKSYTVLTLTLAFAAVADVFSLCLLVRLGSRLFTHLSCSAVAFLTASYQNRSNPAASPSVLEAAGAGSPGCDEHVPGSLGSCWGLAWSWFALPGGFYPSFAGSNVKGESNFLPSLEVAVTQGN